MGGKLAIVACDGALPVQLAEAHPDAIVISFDGVAHQVPKSTQSFRIEHLGALFAELKASDVSDLVFAGSLVRPALDPAEFDPVMTSLAPRFLAAMQAGDDGLLRQVIEIFEEQGLRVVGAHDLLPDLTAAAGILAGPTPEETDLADATRAWKVLQALSGVDVGQGCVVAGGQCLGIETVQGTDALLSFVGQTPTHLKQGHRGVYVKAAKSGQDLRIDMPTVGPKTVRNVAEAGLGGIVIEAGRVMIVDRKNTLEAIESHGLFLMARNA